MNPWRNLLLAVIFVALSGAEGALSAEDGVDLNIAAGRLSLSADAASLPVVLAQVAQATGARLTIRGPLPTELRRWQLHAVPVAEAVVQIARPWNILVVPGGARGVREIVVFGAADVQPVSAPVTTPSARPTDEVWQSPPAPDAETMARREAVAALSGEPDDASLRALDAALGDPDAGVRLEALRGLGRMDSDAAIRRVGQVALGARNPAERSAAVQVLEASRQELAQVMLAAVRGRSDEAFGDR
ncbi:HEAT repeat domain-containing protein [Denitromonas halophila]|uniref:HEAT repeat domain-containing protein n=1 Tax=Denitromonas halophila TaxID=1629404 RepID=A0A557QPB5_9RHOO|nr:HEAT repeat domain-containing protein [Denitromonas halophila]TVO54764.1 HEAT repeat domain-containing protein [Denitromonas halophila]